MRHSYTPDQIDFITKNIPGRSRKEMTEIFNAHFGLELSLNQITSFIKNRGLSNGRDTRFKKGQDTWNKGTVGLSSGGKETQFKKGNRPHSYLPVGSERVNGDGYIDIKIADPNVWEGKHRLIWKEANGPIPDEHVILFGDGDRRNFDLDNLLLVSRAQLRILNLKNLIQNDAELTKTGIVVADIVSKMSERKKTIS